MLHEGVTLAGRVLFGGILLYMASSHLTQHKMLTDYARMKKVPAAGLAVAGAGVVLAVGALSFLVGFRPDIGAILVTLFFVPVTLTMHSFWADTDPMMRMNNKTQFLKNAVILGGAWMTVSTSQSWDLLTLG